MESGIEYYKKWILVENLDVLSEYWNLTIFDKCKWIQNDETGNWLVWKMNIGPESSCLWYKLKPN